MHRVRALLAASSVVLAVASTKCIAQEISWSVENRFPLISDADFGKLQAAWEDLSQPRTMHKLIIQQMNEKSKAGEPSKYLLADAIEARSRARSHVHDTGPVAVLVQIQNVENCTWSITAPQDPPIEIRDGSCVLRTYLRRNVIYRASVTHSAGTATSDIYVKDVLITGMGDSYSAGEGAPDRPAMYDARFNGELLRNNDWFTRPPMPAPPVWFDPTCHRSLLSWQPLAALRLALENKDTTVRLLHAACSGAEFFDGLLVAQSKKVETAAQRSLLQWTLPDGLGPRGWPSYPPPYLPRSQVNAVRDELCEWDTNVEHLDLSEPRRYWATRRVCKMLPMMRPDVLLLTAGGNDVHFGAAVGGTLLPKTARSHWKQPFLNAARDIVEAIAPEKLAENADNLRPEYPELVQRVAEGAGLSVGETVILKYPNPIGTDAIVGGDIGNHCYSPEKQKRIGSSFLAYSVSAKIKSPVYATFPVEFDPDEVRVFARVAIPALDRMIEASGANSVNWLASVTSPTGVTDYDDRLLCTDATDEKRRLAQEQLEPYYFCQAGGSDGCVTRPLNAWNSELPMRRIVNTANDGFLAQRGWADLSDEERFLVGAAGTFHPNAESYAVAADSAFPAICKVIEARHICK